jgi:hypothetical protein
VVEALNLLVEMALNLLVVVGVNPQVVLYIYKCKRMTGGLLLTDFKKFEDYARGCT